MPSACTGSASSLIISDTRSACMVRPLTRACGFAVIFWFKMVTVTKNAPPNSAKIPKAGWKMEIARINNGVHGTSNTAISVEDAHSRCTASKSRWAANAFGSFGTTVRRCMAAENTRRSSRSCTFAPTRAKTRARTCSSTPMITNRPVIRPVKATKVASDWLPSTRS